MIFLLRKSEECRKIRTEIYELKSSILANKAIEIQVKKEQIEDIKFEIMKKKQLHRNKLNEELQEIQDRIKGKCNELEKEENEIRIIEKDIKQTEAAKDSVDSQIVFLKIY